MSDMPPAVERPLSPPGWGGSTAAGWGPNASPAANGWGTSTAGGWGANTGGDDGWGPSIDAGPWDGAATSNAGWGDTAGGWNSAGSPATGRWGTGMTGGDSSGPIIPPPPGATYATGAGQWGTGQTWEQGDSWNNNDNRYTTGLLNDSGPMNPTASGFPFHDSSLAPNSTAFAFPYSSGQTQATRHPSDRGRSTSLRRRTMSAPPDAAYMQPSWMTAMGAPPLAQQSSPYNSTALMERSKSSTVAAGPHMPLDYSPASTLGRSPSGSGSGYVGLPERPSEWRRDFSMRSGLASILPRPRPRPSYSYGDYGPQQRPSLHPFIRFSSNETPVSYDLRLPPRTLSFRAVRREIVASDLTRFACEPPLPYMRLIHPRLPWYIDVHASNPTGVDLSDLFQAIWNCLQWPIQKADFWNDELSDRDRDKISHAWRVRCNGDAFERGSGVRRVDFLRRHVVFEGLVKGRNGTWEMKTRKAMYTD